jgi:hypothetical protein
LWFKATISKKLPWHHDPQAPKRHPQAHFFLGHPPKKNDAGEAYMLNFTYEDDIKIKNKYVAGISRTFYLSTETFSRPPQSRETIPLNISNMKYFLSANFNGQHFFAGINMLL